MQSHRSPLLRHLPILLLLLANLAAGLAVARDYGESWDEASSYRLADQSLAAYSNALHGQSTAFDESDVLFYYGPAFLMAGALLSKAFRAILPGWSPIDGWHFAYFLAFQIGILSMYFLARKWTGTWAAFGAAWLFSTQPLLWGHAFINSRDIPFMAFFLASLTTGIYMADGLQGPTGQNPGPFSVAFWKQALRSFLKPPVLLAGIVLGLATSIRILGPFAGGLVALYALYRYRTKAVPLLIPYFLIAILASYATWPFLWGDPLVHFFESALLMSRFPFVTEVLFRGAVISGADLPWTFIPLLLSIQLTEVMLPLFLAGFGVSIFMFLRKKREPLLLTLIWFILPVLGLILARTALYDNFRQLLFLIPPIFLCAGLALDLLFTRIKPGVLRGLILGILVIPGLYAGIQLHPYQYIYYNAYVGGVRGAFRSFELDYWGTSYREAALYLNRVAPRGASVAVAGPIHLLRHYVRPDMVLSALADAGPASRFDFVVLDTRRNEDQSVCEAVPAAETVERDGAVLAEIKVPPTGGAGGCP